MNVKRTDLPSVKQDKILIFLLVGYETCEISMLYI